MSVISWTVYGLGSVIVSAIINKNHEFVKGERMEWLEGARSKK